MNPVQFDVSELNKSTNEEKYPIEIPLEPQHVEEKIHIVPSTELIPDEYEHTEPKKGLVLIFHSKLDERNKDVLVTEFTDQKYEVVKVHNMSTKESIVRELSTVAQDNHENTTCLIIFFLGIVAANNEFLLEDDDDHILLKDIWSNFTGNKCPGLRNKPKIFIFQATKKVTKLAFDTADYEIPPEGAYNVPSEADMLLVYKKVENPVNREVFVKELCNKIDKFGKRDDIISLVTRTTLKEKRPIIISTLTRKFYLTFSEQRGYSYDLHINHGKILKSLTDLSESVSSKSTEPGRKSYTMQTDSVKAKASTSGWKKVQKTTKAVRPVWKN